MTPALPDLTIFQAYRVRTTAGRRLDVLFRGRLKGTNRLWFTNLDPPYEDVYLRKAWISAIRPLNPQERSPK